MNDRALLELLIHDEPSSWEAAGFALSGPDAVVIDGLVLRLGGEGEPRGIVGWAVDGIDSEVDGLALCPHTPVEANTGHPNTAHPNGVTTIDHLVIATNDFGRTIPAFEAAGLEQRRTRTFTMGGTERQQTFFWAGAVILELIGPVTAEPGPDLCEFWGLAVNTDDIDASATYLGDRLGTPKDAIQKGRRIATLRTKDLGISTPVAFMTPHVSN